VKPFYPDRLLTIGKMYWKSLAYTKKMQRLMAGKDAPFYNILSHRLMFRMSFCSGPLLKHVLEQMDLYKTGAAPKLWLYSGHDGTLVRLGMAMRVWGDFYPDFSNAIIVELHGDEAGNLFVKVGH